MFSTKINIPTYTTKIQSKSSLLFMGSCFSENIGMRLKELYFDVDVNPFGILFNPTSIAQNIALLLEKEELTTDDLFFYNHLWASYAHSSLFSDTQLENTLTNINYRFSLAKNGLLSAHFLVLTFGTAWIYRHSKTDSIVANCHKVPASEFVRERLSAAEITEMYSELIHKLRTLNPNLKLILTVSPVRHWKDGATENNISKGILLQATQEISAMFPNVFYFPAYELLLDELRDYRFYAADMLHPSDVAVDYIFNLFSNSFFDKQTQLYASEVYKYKNAMQHRPIHSETPQYKQFTDYLLVQKQELLNKYPFLTERMKSSFL